MIVTFFTAFEDDDSKLYFSLSHIATNYFSTWFFPDFVSTLPFDIIIPTIVHDVSPGKLRSIKLVRALRLFRLLKLFRVARLNRKMKEAKVNELVYPIIYELGGLFCRIFLIAHILSCMFYYVSGCNDLILVGSEGSEGREGGVYVYDEREYWKMCGHENDLYSQYLLSMYWTMATMLSVG
jgi:hypothetical protein